MHTITKTILAFALPVFAMAQNGPIDFETGGHGASWTWTVFENDTNPALQIIPNPDQSGINTSATVAKFTALQSGQPWAGCETLHGAGTGSFLIDANNAQITIMVWKSEISDVGIKLVRPDSWSLGEIKVANTKVNEWEQLTFDFSAHIGLTPAYDQLVIFPDFNLTGRTSDQVVYFDNVFAAPAFVSVEESELNNAKPYPNPGTSNFRIESQTVIHELRIYNITGDLVSTESVKDLNAEIDASNLSNGVYIIQLEKDSETEVLRWIKQN
jgi:hypothetical protein